MVLTRFRGQIMFPCTYRRLSAMARHGSKFGAQSALRCGIRRGKKASNTTVNGERLDWSCGVIGSRLKN